MLCSTTVCESHTKRLSGLGHLTQSKSSHHPLDMVGTWWMVSWSSSGCRNQQHPQMCWNPPTVNAPRPNAKVNWVLEIFSITQMIFHDTNDNPELAPLQNCNNFILFWEEGVHVSKSICLAQISASAKIARMVLIIQSWKQTTRQMSSWVMKRHNGLHDHVYFVFKLCSINFVVSNYTNHWPPCICCCCHLLFHRLSAFILLNKNSYGRDNS